MPRFSKGAPTPRVKKISHLGRFSVYLVLSLVLCVAISTIVIGERQSAVRTFNGRTSEILPGPRLTMGWLVSERPVAESAEMMRKVSEQLNYDDATYIVYSKGDLRISIYLAYWTPGKMHTRMVGSHTPDGCWTLLGWKRLAGESARVLPLPQERSSLPAEVRHMNLHGHSEWIVFWHIVAGSGGNYGVETSPLWYAPLRDIWRNGLSQRKEQFFVRISANAPVAEWWNLPMVQHVASRLVAGNIQTAEQLIR